MNCKLYKVTCADRQILHQLLQYSLFEESETDLNEMNSDALFEYKWFDSYFTDKDRDAYLIKSDDDRLLGFAMVNTYMQKSDTGHSVAEFMIIPKYRRQKIGKCIAYKLFDMYKGIWEVSPSYGSEKAFQFWEHIISEYTKSNYNFSDGIFVFKSGE
ncbi:MAG: GNAT family N-acetyltransferase [Ruminococcaceae bacterium]|nr:GNAT family N-acetyltransferase [Oscillospiraceae bacterium]